LPASVPFTNVQQTGSPRSVSRDPFSGPTTVLSRYARARHMRKVRKQVETVTGGLQDAAATMRELNETKEQILARAKEQNDPNTALSRRGELEAELEVLYAKSRAAMKALDDEFASVSEQVPWFRVHR